MKEKPLVSVAIITYNQKEYLKECIESVLEQDYPNIEIVVADDCSTDGTQEMLKAYSEKYPGKFVLKLSETNLGITPNSNVAHFACSGKYIAWIGGDDLMLPNKISKQVEYMENNKDYAICYHDLDVFESDTNKTLYIQSKKVKPRSGTLTEVAKYGCFNGACSTMVVREKTPESGFNLSLPVASDWMYWLDTLKNGGKIGYIDKVLGRYRRHSNNVTNKNNKVGQNQVDHLITCTYLLCRKDILFSDYIRLTTANFIGMRHQLEYGAVLRYSFLNVKSIKSLLALMIYYLSFGKLKV